MMLVSEMPVAGATASASHDSRPNILFAIADPYRPYEKGSGAQRQSGMKIEDVRVPPFLPDAPEVRSDILDYYYEVERFDRDVGGMIRLTLK